MNVACGVEMSELSKQCGAEVDEMNWTNGVKGGRLWGTNAVPRNAMWEVNEPTASTWKSNTSCIFSAQLMGGGVFVVFLIGGTPWLSTFLEWFYLNQARYVFRSAYLVNVFDKLFGYQYHLPATLAKRLLSQALLVLFLQFCLLFGVIILLPLSRRGFNGVNSSQ